MAFSLFSYFFKRVVENMAASFKDRYRRNKETLEWYDALAMAVAVIALVFTFGVRIVKVDGHSMDPTLSNGERILINLLKKPDYDDIVVVDGYTEYGRPSSNGSSARAGTPSILTLPPVSSTATARPSTSPTPPSLRIYMKAWTFPSRCRTAACS